MAKKRGDKQPTEETEGVRFREGYYQHHGLEEGRACTKEENDACMEIVKLVLAKKLSELAGQERIAGILHPEVPF